MSRRPRGEDPYVRDLPIHTDADRRRRRHERNAMTETADRNDLAYWFPFVRDAGLPVPKTHIEHSPDLTDLLDGQPVHGHLALVSALVYAGDELGWPCFLRTGHGSGKHQWEDTCFVADPEQVSQHVFNLVEWSHMVHIMGLPTTTWAIREMLPTAPLFHCRRYGNFPVVREFRLFVRDGELDHAQPYWPEDAARDGDPDARNWEQRLKTASMLVPPELAELEAMALRAAAAVGGGYWSVDLLQDRNDRWWLTDMAEGDKSWRDDASQ